MGWTLPLVASGLQGILNALQSAPTPNQGAYATEETAAQFTAARDAALALLVGGVVGSAGIFTVRLSGQVQEEHGVTWDIPLEAVTVEIARHQLAPEQTYSAGPVTVTLRQSGPDPLASAPIEAVTLEIARHQPRVGARSYQ